MRKPWLHRRGGPCALPAESSCNNGKNVRRIRTSCEYAELFVCVYCCAAGRGRAAFSPVPVRVGSGTSRTPSPTAGTKTSARSRTFPAVLRFSGGASPSPTRDAVTRMPVQKRAADSRPYEIRCTFSRSSLFCSRSFLCSSCSSAILFLPGGRLAAAPTRWLALCCAAGADIIRPLWPPSLREVSAVDLRFGSYAATQPRRSRQSPPARCSTVPGARATDLPRGRRRRSAV